MLSYYDVIVIGGGSMGMSAGYYLAKQKVKTLVIDAFDPPHSFGSHHGDTRLYRYAYGHAAYVPLAIRAKELFEELEKESGQRVYLPTGVVTIGSIDDPFIRDSKQVAASLGINVEHLTSKEIIDRWPGFRLPYDFIGLYEPEAGILLSESCVKAYRELALRAGVTLQINNPVSEINYDQDRVKIKTYQGDTFYSNKLIVSAGAWNKRLLPSLPLILRRKTVSWFPAEESLYDSSHFPGFLINVGPDEYYGFPSIEGCGIKIGNHSGGIISDPDYINRTYIANSEEEQDLKNKLQAFFPQATPICTQGKVCIYSLTPDEHFIIDQHPQHKNVWIAAGFSGHGFKFASAVGEILAQWAQGQKPDYDLSLFSLNRFRSDVKNTGYKNR